MQAKFLRRFEQMVEMFAVLRNTQQGICVVLQAVGGFPR